MPLISSNNIHTLWKFADLVRITVVKLQEEGNHGELRDRILFSLLIKKLPGHQPEGWLNKPTWVKLVTAFRGQIPNRGSGNGEWG